MCNTAYCGLINNNINQDVQEERANTHSMCGSTHKLQRYWSPSISVFNISVLMQGDVNTYSLFILQSTVAYCLDNRYRSKVTGIPIYCFCTSYLFCTFILLHILLFISLFLTYRYALVLWYFYIIFYFYSFALSTERTWFDYISLLNYTLYNLLCDE